ncbi:MAG: hypothetical protein JSU68_06250 [Phycisphaerales bacterium]|nr:MAG: hypothetical protein JSU68_06250 [Phycisphaerales bacterium]
MCDRKAGSRGSLILGVDFSGAADAGTKLWICCGGMEREELRVESCFRGQDLPGSARERDTCLRALRVFIARSGPSAVGLDFPFGLPGALMPEGSWGDFAVCFAASCESPGAFRRECYERAGRRELKRATDVEARTPFSPYNLRLYRQTYYGIGDVLGPLVADEAVSVLPMQQAKPDRPWLLEICPASTLKSLGMYAPYKGRIGACRAGRERILSRLEGAGSLRVADEALREVVIEDAGGDALDSVLGAWATARGLRDGLHLSVPATSVYAREGYVYA